MFGKELSDGFLVGEINDRRGLVPANFVSEVNRLPNKVSACVYACVCVCVCVLQLH